MWAIKQIGKKWERESSQNMKGKRGKEHRQQHKSPTIIRNVCMLLCRYLFKWNNKFNGTDTMVKKCGIANRSHSLCQWYYVIPVYWLLENNHLSLWENTFSVYFINNYNELVGIRFYLSLWPQFCRLWFRCCCSSVVTKIHSLVHFYSRFSIYATICSWWSIFHL